MEWDGLYYVDDRRNNEITLDWKKSQKTIHLLYIFAYYYFFSSVIYFGEVNFMVRGPARPESEFEYQRAIRKRTSFTLV